MSGKNKNTKRKTPLYYPQNYLLYQVGVNQASKLAKSFIPKINNGPTIAKMVGSYSPQAAANVFNPTSKKGIKMSTHFLNLDNHKIPFLVPEIRLYKVVGSSAIPIYMPVASDFGLEKDLINKEKVFSGAGVELQNFSVTLSGKNPYDVTRKFLNASLTIRVENISIIFDEKQGFAPIADLFTIRAPSPQPIPGSDAPSGGNALSRGRNCHVAVTFGYAIQDQATDENIFTPDEANAIIQQQAAFNLFYSSHDLNLSPDGSATISINYTGFMKSMEDFYSDMTSGPADKANMAIKTTFQKDAASISKNIKPAKDKKKKKDTDPEPKKDYSDIQEFFKKIVDNLYHGQKKKKTSNDGKKKESSSKIHSIEFTDFKKFYDKASTAPSAPTSADVSLTKSSPPPGQNAGPQSNSPAAAQKDPSAIFDQNPVHYFTFGDFLAEYFRVMVSHLKDASAVIDQKRKKKIIKTDQAASKAKKKLLEFSSDLKKLTVLMADCEITDDRPDGKTTKLNVADIPISVDSLYTLVFDKLTSLGSGFYDMNSFMTSFCPALLSKALQTDSAGGSIIKKTTIQTLLMTGRGLRRKVYKGSVKFDDIPDRNGSFTRDNIATTDQYFLFCQKPSSNTKVVGSGRLAEDASNGIFAIRPNKDKGLVKSVSFSKISNPSREAFLVVTAGDVYDELRIPHNATATFVGNNLFLPGSMAFIDPDSLGFGHPGDTESAAQKLGLGGYYTIETVKHSYSAGAIETQLTLKFNHFPDGKGGAGLSKTQAQSIKKVQSIIAGGR